MNRLAAVAWKIVDVADMRTIAERDLRNVNDNVGVLARDGAAIPRREGRALRVN